MYTATEGTFQIGFALEEGTAWGVTVLPKGKYLANPTAIIPESSANGPVAPTSTPTTQPATPENQTENPKPPTIGLDSDNDGLTDVEESLYHAVSTKVDSDGDGYKDGEELIAGYDPADKIKRIWQATTTAVYRNQAYGYSFIYPKPWVAKSIDDGKETLFTDSNTNEFFDVLVQDNPLGLSAINWYLRQNPNVNPNLLTTVTVANLPATQTADGLVTYVSSGSKLFIISYNVGVGKEANFFATYKMLLKTWQFSGTTTSAPAAEKPTPSSTPDQTNSSSTSES
ncbi:MAG: thrombospondin type 3 repeat-containing protein [Candidatus Komeilibacteria bacterium]|nr:thrombospondin type 3 repeat-containing protein [Candidatus Komeilibacteria bacterium]